MTTYYDHCWDTADVSRFLPALAAEPNIIGPKSGDADVPGSDPARFYLNLRAPRQLPVPEGCALTDPATSAALLGVWA